MTVSCFDRTVGIRDGFEHSTNRWSTMIAAIADDQIFDKGQSVGLVFDAAKAHLFDELPLETDQAH